MSSAAIMALIKQKESELNKIKFTKNELIEVSDSVDCMSRKFNQAGILINEAGNINGNPFDNGSTTIMGSNFKKLSASTLQLLSDLESKITALEAEIQGLYSEYRAALAREEAERRAAEAAAAAARLKEKGR